MVNPLDACTNDGGIPVRPTVGQPIGVSQIVQNALGDPHLMGQVMPVIDSYVQGKVDERIGQLIAADPSPNPQNASGGPNPQQAPVNGVSGQPPEQNYQQNGQFAPQPPQTPNPLEKIMALIPLFMQQQQPSGMEQMMLQLQTASNVAQMFQRPYDEGMKAMADMVGMSLKAGADPSDAAAAGQQFARSKFADTQSSQGQPQSHNTAS